MSQPAPNGTSLPKVELFSSVGVGAARKIFIDETADLFEIRDGGEIYQLSNDPPSFLRLAADAATWGLVLKVAATAFLSQLAKNAADDLWKNKKAIADTLTNAAVGPLVKLVRAIGKVRKAAPETTIVGVGTLIPDGYFGARVRLLSKSDEDTATTLALFVSHAPEIERAIKNRNAEGAHVLGPVEVYFEADGTAVVTWLEMGEDFREIRLKPKF